VLLSHTDPANPGLSRGRCQPHSHSQAAAAARKRPCWRFVCQLRPLFLSSSPPSSTADQLLNQWRDARSRERYENATFLVLVDRDRAVALFIYLSRSMGPESRRLEDTKRRESKDRKACALMSDEPDSSRQVRSRGPPGSSTTPRNNVRPHRPSPQSR
jgi:hypothetical protein